MMHRKLDLATKLTFMMTFFQKHSGSDSLSNEWLIKGNDIIRRYTTNILLTETML